MSLLPLILPGAQRLQVMDDYGPIGKGASAAHTMAAENGSDFLVKGPTLSPANPYVGANEFIAAALAGLLGLPLLEWAVLDMGGRLFFGSRFMTAGTFYPAITDPLFQQCENKDRVYDMYAFDFWVSNIDRHQENLVVRRTAARAPATPQRHTLLLNDHSHCLLAPGRAPGDLAAMANAPPQPLMRAELAFAARQVTQPSRLSDAIAAIEQVADATIEALVNGVPDQLLPVAAVQAVIDYLIARRNALRVLVRGSACFPNLTGPLP